MATAGHLHVGPGQRVDRGLDQVAVDADGGHGRARRVGGIGAPALGAQRPDLARRVLPFEGGEVDHADGEVEGERLGGGLDRPGGEAGGPGLDAHLVDAGQAVEEPSQRGGGGDGVGQLFGGGRRRRRGRGHTVRVLPAGLGRRVTGKTGYVCSDVIAISG